MKHAVMLAAIFGAAFLLARSRIPSAPYFYDEADYMFAASLGLEHNWLDAGTMPVPEFVRVGSRRGPDPQQQGALSELARESGDPVVYRHWHGPLYYYFLAIPSHLRLDEHDTRVVSFVFPVLTALVMYFGSLLILGGTEGQVAAILSSSLFLWSPVTLETSELAPHMLFVLICVCALMMLAKVAADGGRRYYYAAVVFSGLAFCTMEVAFVAILVLPAVAWWRRDSLASDRVLARNSAGFFLATVLAAWPAALLKLSFVKAYLVMVYLAVFRKGAWGNVTFAQTWRFRFLISPVEWFLLVLALVLLVLPGKRRARAGAVTFLLFAALMILATIRVYAEIPRYMTPFFAALELFTAWMLAPALARLRGPWLPYGAVIAICGLLIWNAHQQLSGFLLREDPRPAAVLSALRASGLAEKTLLAPRVAIPTLHYYFPRMHIQGYSGPADIPAAQNGGHADAVLYPDYSLKIDSPAGRP